MNGEFNRNKLDSPCQPFLAPLNGYQGRVTAAAHPDKLPSEYRWPDGLPGCLMEAGVRSPQYSNGMPLQEKSLIKRIRLRARGGSAVVTGIGDDCAVLRLPPGHELLVTTDFTIEKVHFRRDWHRPDVVGRQAQYGAIVPDSCHHRRPAPGPQPDPLEQRFFL